MLKGKSVNLSIVEKEDLHLLFEWFNKSEVMGKYNSIRQHSLIDMENIFEKEKNSEFKNFII